MNYIAQWEQAHLVRFRLADHADPRLVEFCREWFGHIDAGERARIRWLDIGCGVGISCIWLAAKGFTVDGFDGAPYAITKAASIEFQGKERVRYDVADAAGPWPYASDSFDAAIDIRSLENLTSNELFTAYSECVRVLKPGGVFFALHASPGRDDSLTEVGKVWKPTESSLRFICSTAGFKALRAKIVSRKENGREVEDWQIEAQK